MTAINCENLSLKIGENQILQNFSFTLSAGETLVFMGKNGCGKTMLLKTLVGLFKPQSGSAQLLGQNIFDLEAKKLDELRKKIGYVFQKSGLFDSMNVAENVIFGLRRFQGGSNESLMKQATNFLERSGLKGVESKLPSELSGGMQKRAGIARAIAMNPKLLLMDDPTAGLDPVLTDAIADLIVSLREDLNCASIVTTHDLSFAKKLADRIGLIINGKLHCIVDVDEFYATNEPYIEQFREGLLEGPIAVIE